MDDNEKRYDVDALKARLVAYRETMRDIENQRERLERIETRLYSIGSPNISDMPKAQSSTEDRETNLIYMKKTLIEEIEELENLTRSEHQFIESVLKKLKHADEKAVIRMRYFDFCSWYDVVDMLFGGKEDFLGKEDTYLRRAHKIHGSALLNMAIILDDKSQ